MEETTAEVMEPREENRPAEGQGAAAPSNTESQRSSGYRGNPNYRGGGNSNYQNSQGGPNDRRMMHRRRKKVCEFCKEKVEHIDYKDTLRLRKFLSERSKILPRRITGTCAKHQRVLTEAVKRARQIALIPYISD